VSRGEGFNGRLQVAPDIGLPVFDVAKRMLQRIAQGVDRLALLTNLARCIVKQAVKRLDAF
jgi:hypothetical protein